jgi:antitoxin ParD1/3/4
MRRRTFNCTRHLSVFIERQLAEGRHQNASEVVREALRRYQQDFEAERTRLGAIAAVAEQGIADIERGAYTLVHGSDGSSALLARLNTRGAYGGAVRKKLRGGKRHRT